MDSSEETILRQEEDISQYRIFQTTQTIDDRASVKFDTTRTVHNFREIIIYLETLLITFLRDLQILKASFLKEKEEIVRH